MQADAQAIPLKDQSVQCVVTSPPYWGLRDYGTATWIGGDGECDHKYEVKSPLNENFNERWGNATGQKKQESERHFVAYRDECGKCGATRVDKQIGLEKTPQEYVAKMVAVFREVWRVLKDDGTLWLNLGDSYAQGSKGNSGAIRPGDKQGTNTGSLDTRRGERLGPNRNGGTKGFCKPKDLVGIPWRCAFALQQPYYTGIIKDERDRLYMAGLLDGEGTFTILETTSPHGSGNSFPPTVQIRMCDEAPLAWVASIIGVCSPAQYPPARNGKRAVYQWRLIGDRAAAVAREMYPYLKVKKKQALLVWNQQLVRNGYHTKRGVKIPVESVEKMQVLRALIRKANKGERIDIPSWCVEPSLCLEPGWYLRSDCIWSKPNPMPESVTDRPTKSHEYIFMLTKNERYFWDQDAVREPGAGRIDLGCMKFGGRMQQGAWYKDNGEKDAAGRNIRTVWEIATQPYSEAHFATFPEALAERCIKAGSKLGDIVFDPFGGSGTVVQVAQDLGRIGIAGELNPEYLHLAKRRSAQQGFGLVLR